MTKIRSMLVDQSIMGGPERRGDERSEAPRSGGSPIIEPDAVPVPPDSEVPRAMRDGALRPPTSWRSSGGRTPVHGTANSGHSCERRGCIPHTSSRGASSARPG